MIEEGTVTASRPRHRVVRAAAVSALLLSASAPALAACSAGQVTQTSTQVSSVSGVNVDVGKAPNGGPVVALRNVMFAYNGTAGFPVGGKAPMIVRLFNETAVPLKLTGVEAPGVGQVVLSGAPGESVGASPEPSPGASPGASEAPAGDTTISVEIPAHGYTELVPGEGAFLQITKLTKKIAPGDLVPVTFTFSDGSSATLKISTSPPSVPAERSPLPLEEGHE
jgi:copper(I)-binding protein